MSNFNQYDDKNINDVNFVMVDEENTAKVDLNNGKKNKKTGKGRRRIASYVAVALICTVVGAGGATAGVLYGLPSTNFFKNTPLYQSLNTNSNSNINTTAASNYVRTSLPQETKGGLSVPEIVKKVGPAVVGVAIKGVQVDNFYGIPKNMEGIGSGVIFSEDGYILTNYHVINGAQEIKVIFNNNKEVNAKVINYDANMDLAVIKVTDDVKMPGVIEFGSSSSLQVGELTVAIGNPLGKEFIGTVTTGIVSAVNRNLNENEGQQQSKQGSVNYIQTNAAINPGNSGGALVNSAGQLIGINTAKISQEGVEGIGFAIPVDSIKPKIEQLVKPILTVGIQGRTITSELSKQTKYPEGVYIAQVLEFSPAEKAGLKSGDVITSFDGQKIKTIEELNQIKQKHKEGDIVKVEIVRDGKSKVLELQLK